MWLDREKTAQEAAENPLVAINLKENVTGDILGISLAFANTHSPFFEIGEEPGHNYSEDEGKATKESDEVAEGGREL